MEKKFNLKKYLIENNSTKASRLRSGILKENHEFSDLEKHNPTDPNTISYNMVADEWDSGKYPETEYFPGMSFRELDDEVQERIHRKYANVEDYETSSEYGGDDYDDENDQAVLDAEMDSIDVYDSEYGDMDEGKLSKSALTKKIKEMILAELSGNDVVAKEYDPLDEAKKDEEEEPTEEPIEDEEIEITDDFSTDDDNDPGHMDVTQDANADLTGNKKKISDNLEAALEAAKKMNDDKLVTQIGNSLTFFTKQHVVKENTIREGYFSNTKLEEWINAIGYESFEDFFSDNPGAEDALMDWIMNIPDFIRSLEGAELLGR